MSLNKIYLHVYDLQPEQNELLYQVGLGMYHSGVTVGGNEYTFAGGGGVYSHPPKEASGARFREAVDYGNYAGTSRDLDRVLDELREHFKGENYHLLTMNCNSFSEALLQRLVGKSLPGYVNRMAYLGSFFSCLLPPQLANEAPVNAASGGGSAGGRGAPARITANPFAGAGRKLLPAAPASAAASSHNEAADQQERKEKMRAAALSRLQQQPNPSS